MRPRNIWLAAALAFAIRLAADAATEAPNVATFSVVACDPETGELGVAVESKFFAVGAVVPYAEAGVGAIASQAFANTTFGPRGLKLLREGHNAQQTLDLLLADDPQRARRQVGIVDAKGNAATYTGGECHAWAGGRQGPAFVVQGNILVSEATVTAMERAFRDTPGMLGERLMRAIEEGQRAGGDARGMQSAAILIVKTAAGYGGYNDRYCDLRVDDHPEPIRELRRLFELWRPRARAAAAIPRGDAKRLPAQAAAPSGDPFDSAHLLEVRITLPAKDWDALRFQARDARAEFSRERFDQPPSSPYTWFKADVVLDGVVITNVGVRKRGFYGSAHIDRPALNLDLARYTRGQSWSGLRELKLHNNRQDPSQMRQVLAYQVFRAAGVPAPRCRLARVEVNGKDLGVYSQVEAIDDAFLQREFGSTKGNLYELAIGDFKREWLPAFDLKNNRKRGSDRAELEAVASALQLPDDTLIEQLERVIDLEAFLRFWAVESLINHWDGYNGDQNNSFVYHDPATGKLRFIAWGADSTFTYRHVFVPFQPPASVLAVARLPHRLYNHPAARERYRDHLRSLLQTVWNEDALLAEVQRLEHLCAPRVTLPQGLLDLGLNQVREFIRTRRSQVEAELAPPAQPWNFPQRRELHFADLGTISATFSGAWVTNVLGSQAPQGQGRLELEYYGRRYVGEIITVRAGPRSDNVAQVSLYATARFPDVEPPITLWLATDGNLFRSGRSFPITGKETMLSLFAGDLLGDDFRLLAWFGGGGTVELDQAGMEPGAPIRGRVTAGTLTLMPWEDFDLRALKAAVHANQN
jgi:uncharacterized Ntn-hydrolase superfamily protein